MIAATAPADRREAAPPASDTGRYKRVQGALELPPEVRATRSSPEKKKYSTITASLFFYFWALMWFVDPSEPRPQLSYLHPYSSSIISVQSVPVVKL